MIRIGLICEGISEFKIINHIIARFFGDDVVVNPIQPKIRSSHGSEKQDGFGGWLQVLEHCSDDSIQGALNYNDYIVVQIDTDACEQSHYDVKTTNNDGSKKSKEELYNDITARLLQDLSQDLLDKYKDKIIFAICFNEIECWLLPVFYTDNNRCKTNNCIYTLNKALEKHNIRGIPDTDKNSSEAQKTYNAILKKHFKRKSNIKTYSIYNLGFKNFIMQLSKIDDVSKENDMTEMFI